MDKTVFNGKPSTISNFCRYLRTGTSIPSARSCMREICGCLSGSGDNLVKFVLMLRGGGETRDFHKVSYRKFWVNLAGPHTS